MFDVKLPPWEVILALVIIGLIFIMYRWSKTRVLFVFLWSKKRMLVTFLRRHIATIWSCIVFVSILICCVLLLWRVPVWTFDVHYLVGFFAFIFLIMDIVKGWLVEDWREIPYQMNRTLFFLAVLAIFASGQEQTALILIIVTTIAVLIRRVLSKLT